MCSGFFVIGRAYKRGDGRLDKGKEPWSTEPLRSLLHWQSGLGVLALICFACSVSSWGQGTSSEEDSGSVTISIPGGTSAPLGVAVLDGQLQDGVRVEGHWSILRIRTAEGSVVLDAVPEQEMRRFVITGN